MKIKIRQQKQGVKDRSSLNGDNWASMIVTCVIANANASEFARFIAKGGDTLEPRVGPCFSLSACRS